MEAMVAGLVMDAYSEFDLVGRVVGLAGGGTGDVAVLEADTDDCDAKNQHIRQSCGPR